MIGGGSSSSAVGANSVVTTCSESYKVAVTCSKLRVAKLSCVAAVCPTDSPVMTETVESSEMSLAMSTIVGGPGALTDSGRYAAICLGLRSDSILAIVFTSSDLSAIHF